MECEGCKKETSHLRYFCEHCHQVTERGEGAGKTNADYEAHVGQASAHQFCGGCQTKLDNNQVMNCPSCGQATAASKDLFQGNKAKPFHNY